MAEVNRTLLVVGYGSLLSGYGMLAERRQGKSRLVARGAWPVLIENARRGLAKPSSHGSYLAMDVEPIDATRPIHVRVTRGKGRAGEVGGILFEFDREWAGKIAMREEYDSAMFVRLLEAADQARRPLGEFLLALAEAAAFNLDGYRRELCRILGYTSPGYIFHPVALDNGRVAIIAIGSGYHSSGDDAVISRRREFRIERQLSLAEALALEHMQIDRAGQIGYFAECLLGGLHGVAVADLMDGFDPASQWGRDLLQHLARVAHSEHQHFLGATSMDERTYEKRFGRHPAPALKPLLKLAGVG
jgi:hypothetical protein